MSEKYTEFIIINDLLKKQKKYGNLYITVESDNTMKLCGSISLKIFLQQLKIKRKISRHEYKKALKVISKINDNWIADWGLDCLSVFSNLNDKELRILKHIIIMVIGEVKTYNNIINSVIEKYNNAKELKLY